MHDTSHKCRISKRAAGTRDIFAHSGTVPGNPGQLVTLSPELLTDQCNGQFPGTAVVFFLPAALR